MLMIITTTSTTYRYFFWVCGGSTAKVKLALGTGNKIGHGFIGRPSLHLHNIGLITPASRAHEEAFP